MSTSLDTPITLTTSTKIAALDPAGNFTTQEILGLIPGGLDANGTLNLSGETLSGVWANLANSVVVPDLSYFGFVKPGSGIKAGGMYWWDGHSGGGELILESSARIAIAPGLNGEYK